jgi:hypothetical protein
MKSTTIYVPVTTAQAEWSFLNRVEAFKRGFDTDGGQELAGFRFRDGAIAAASNRHIRSFAVLRITFDAVTHETLAFTGQLRGDDRLWHVTAEGLLQLAACADLSMEILPGTYQMTDMQKVDPFGLPEGGPTGFGGC